jgi:hypothetical protein
MGIVFSAKRQQTTKQRYKMKLIGLFLLIFISAEAPSMLGAFIQLLFVLTIVIASFIYQSRVNNQ